MTYFVGFISGVFIWRHWGFWLFVGVMFYLATRKSKPNKNKMSTDLLKLKADLSRFSGKMVKLAQEDIELLSLNIEEKDGRLSRGQSGSFVSIYHEPVLGYSYKVYPANNQFAALWVTTAEDEFVYRITPDQTHIQVNGSDWGEIKDDGVFYRKDKGTKTQLIEKIGGGYTIVKIGDKVAGHVLSISSNNNDVNPRAFDLVDGHLSNEERQTFLALAFLLMVRQNVK